MNLEIETKFKELDKNLEENFYKFFPKEEGDRIVYHYTSLAALEKIIYSSSIHMTDYSCTNDEMEIEFAHKLFCSFLENKKAEEKFKNFAEAYQKIITDSYPNLLGAYKSNSYYNIFIVSFSVLSDYLPLWRYYGDDGKGVSLGLQVEVKPIEKSIYNLLDPVYQNSLVCYDEIKFQNYCQNWLEIVFESINGNKEEINKNEYIDHLITITQYVIGTYSFSKNKDWESEKEYRMYYLYDKKNHIKNTSKIIEITNSGSFLKKNPEPTKHVFVNQFDKSSIKEIIVGPKLDFEKTKNEIESWLSKNNYDLSNIKIIQSKKVYR